MDFKKYQHVERLGSDEIEGLLDGECYIFPKIDGTNGVVWAENQVIQAGSRKRRLSMENDNAGFYFHVSNNKNIKQYLEDNPTHRLFGEFLVKHTIKYYEDTAWNKFYVFDVMNEYAPGKFEYIPYEVYSEKMEFYGINYIPPLEIVDRPSIEDLENLLGKADFLLKSDRAPELQGEGIVVKRYDFRNHYGRTTWGKLVTKEFKARKSKPKTKLPRDGHEAPTLEVDIVDRLCTESFIEKEFAKFTLENSGFSSKMISKFLGVVWHEFIKEETWEIIKRYKNPTVNFKVLHSLVIAKIKEVNPNNIF